MVYRAVSLVCAIMFSWQAKATPLANDAHASAVFTLSEHTESGESRNLYGSIWHVRPGEKLPPRDKRLIVPEL